MYWWPTIYAIDSHATLIFKKNRIATNVPISISQLLLCHCDLTRLRSARNTSLDLRVPICHRTTVEQLTAVII